MLDTLCFGRQAGTHPEVFLLGQGVPQSTLSIDSGHHTADHDYPRPNQVDRLGENLEWELVDHGRPIRL
jgi:hypothetical protein